MTDSEFSEELKNIDIENIVKQRNEDVKLPENNSNLTNKLSNFNVKKFNIDFDVEKALKEKQRKQNEKTKLEKLEKPEPKKKVFELSIGEILIGIKDVWFEILDDLLQQRFNLSIFTKNNRIFFIGLTITIVVIMIYLYELLTQNDNENNNNSINLNNPIKEVHHIYHLVKPNGEVVENTTKLPLKNILYENSQNGANP